MRVISPSYANNALALTGKARSKHGPNPRKNPRNPSCCKILRATMNTENRGELNGAAIMRLKKKTVCLVFRTKIWQNEVPTFWHYQRGCPLSRNQMKRGRRIERTRHRGSTKRGNMTDAHKVIWGKEQTSNRVSLRRENPRIRVYKEMSETFRNSLNAHTS